MGVEVWVGCMWQGAGVDGDQRICELGSFFLPCGPWRWNSESGLAPNPFYPMSPLTHPEPLSSCFHNRYPLSHLPESEMQLEEFFFKEIFILCFPAYIKCMCTTCVPSDSRGQKSMADFLELESQIFVSTMWVLGAQPGSSKKRTASPLKHWAALQSQKRIFNFKI